MRRAAALLLLLVLLAPAPGAAASRFLPHLRFRVLNTPHFRVYYHQGEEQVAHVLAGIAESVRASLPARLGLPAPDVTHVLLANQDDAANGWATPLPYNTVMVTAAWPAPSDLIGNTSDWLRMVFVHEFTHVLQLHQSRGWARGARAIFGRAPFAFPNLFLPQWEVEGLATFAESRATGQGRVMGGDSLAIVRDRVGEVGRQRLDQVNGGQVEWPGGEGPYLYGGFFAEYLAERFGEEKLGAVAMRSAGRLPYLASPAFRSVFGAGLGELWLEYQQSLTAGWTPSAGGPTAQTRPSLTNSPPTKSSWGPPSGGLAIGGLAQSRVRRLTNAGYYVSTPRFTADGRVLVYATRNADDFPALVVRDVSARGDAGRRLAVRYGGEQVSVARGIVYYDQADYSVNVAWRSDLYAADLATHRVQRLTRGARLLAPDASPDGRWLAAIRMDGEGARTLALFRVAGERAGALSLSEVTLRGTAAGASYGSPRWAPDGRRLAVERRMPGGPSEIVVFDMDAGSSTVVVSTPGRRRSLTPAWTPGGGRLLFASDRDGGAFQIYSVAVGKGEVRRVLAVPGGALSPDVSPDGTTLVYVGYTASGYDLFEAPLGEGDRLDASPREAPDALVGPPSSPDGQPTLEARPAAYHPLYTLLPRSWSPAGDTANGNVRLGFSTGGQDVLGRHAFGVTVLWRLRGGEDAMRGAQRSRPDWSAFYAYDRYRPTLFAAASDETSFLPQFAGGHRLGDAELRERSMSVGVSLPFLVLRHGQVWQSALNVQHDTFSGFRGRRGYDRNALQTGWAFNSGHLFGFSISPEQGVSIGVTSEQVRTAFGADGNADAFTGEVRGYARLGGRHAVLASRAAVGTASGDWNVVRMFYLGGAEPAGALIDFGSGAFTMLRGFADKQYGGTHIAVANLEYRFPLWRIERGRGTWPLFLRTLHGAVFADTGQVWDDGFKWSATKASFGAELSLDAVLGFGLPVTVSAGVARWRADAGYHGTTGYLRLGRAF